MRVGSHARITARPFGRERRARNGEREGKKDLTGRAWASYSERINGEELNADRWAVSVSERSGGWAVGAEEVRALGRLGLRAMVAAAGLALLLGQVQGEGVAGPTWKWVGLLGWFEVSIPSSFLFFSNSNHSN